jgi:transcriptional regulator with XRE-family HTH domain
MSEVVALLLDDAMPAERLGALLRAARKRRGLKRKQAAAAAGTTAAKLRAYERGDKPCPARVCAQLAECYGDDLTAHVPLRVSPVIDNQRVAIGAVEQPVGPDSSDVIAGYVDIVQRLRNSGQGDPLALRTVDIAALAGALGCDRDEIEERISSVLGCSRTEASRLHNELLRRKVILPVAGLAAGMAAFAGVAYASPSPASPTHLRTQAVVAAVPSTTSTTVALKPVAPTPVAPKPNVTPTTATTPTTTAPVAHESQITTPTTDAPVTDATVPPAQQQPEVPVSLAPPQPDPNDPPVSILPGETPITVIGTPDSTSNTP